MLAALSDDDTPVDVAMTTNGATLARDWRSIFAARDCDRVNISLDSLKPDRFAELTIRDELDRVLAGVDAAVEAGFDPVKLNVVAMAGVNEDEIVDFAAFGRERGVMVRFIEFMPLDADEIWLGRPSCPRRRSSPRSMPSTRWIRRAWQRTGRAVRVPRRQR